MIAKLSVIERRMRRPSPSSGQFSQFIWKGEMVKVRPASAERAARGQRPAAHGIARDCCGGTDDIHQISSPAQTPVLVMVPQVDEHETVSNEIQRCARGEME